MPLVRRPSEKQESDNTDFGEARVLLLAGTPPERWAAARLLSTSPDGVSVLIEALHSERDTRVLEAIFTALAKIATPESAYAALPYLRCDDATLRTAALDALRAMPRAVRPHLKALLDDPNDDVRLLACEIVRNLDETDATGLLCTLLDAEQQANVCASAIDVVAEIGTCQALPSLERCMQRFPHDPFIAFAVKIASDSIRSRSGA